jgi:hypothetical protein
MTSLILSKMSFLTVTFFTVSDRFGDVLRDALRRGAGITVTTLGSMLGVVVEEAWLVIGVDVGRTADSSCCGVGVEMGFATGVERGVERGEEEGGGGTVSEVDRGVEVWTETAATVGVADDLASSPTDATAVTVLVAVTPSIAVVAAAAITGDVTASAAAAAAAGVVGSEGAGASLRVTTLFLIGKKNSGKERNINGRD